ncbi:MAG: hypothetical protein ACKPKS_19750, partial [Dolichospermum sp.]
VTKESAELTITVDTFLNKAVDETEIRQLIALIRLIKILKFGRNYEYYFDSNMIRGQLAEYSLSVVLSSSG